MSCCFQPQLMVSPRYKVRLQDAWRKQLTGHHDRVTLQLREKQEDRAGRSRAEPGGAGRKTSSAGMDGLTGAEKAGEA